MSGPIQTIPQGLLGLLQLKQTGRNPSDLLETVTPTAELFKFWINRQITDLSALLSGGQASRTIATAAPGIYGFVTNPLSIPQNTAWWVENYTLVGSLLAGETIVIAPAMFVVGLPSPFYVLAPPWADVITARARNFAVSITDRWVMPGMSLGFVIYDDLTAGNITVNGFVRGVSVPV